MLYHLDRVIQQHQRHALPTSEEWSSLVNTNQPQKGGTSPLARALGFQNKMKRPSLSPLLSLSLPAEALPSTGTKGET